ncbi:MAG: hypothetical protein HUJ68_12750 [Clostridia bacterium]|nr:hypothetical protein [Clostridia bacterium]
MAYSCSGAIPIRVFNAPISTLELNKVELTDCTMNAIKLDSGSDKVTVNQFDEEISEPIIPKPSNLPVIHNNAWSDNTKLYASFNGNLEAGRFSFNGKPIDNLLIRRASNRTNFLNWDTIKILPNAEGDDDDDLVVFKDKTIESGLWYQYALQVISENQYGNLNKVEKRNAIYYHGFLVGQGGRQLKIKYDFTISSKRRNIKENRVETIGSKYPFVVRSGHTDYKEFNMTGLITHFIDETEYFAPRAEIFLDEDFMEDYIDLTEDYDTLYEKNDLDGYNNIVLEREFGKKVEEFLYDGEIKLLKCPKEGNYLVRLTDITLTPRADINNGQVYMFSCNAIEVDVPTIENIAKYNIQSQEINKP